MRFGRGRLLWLMPLAILLASVLPRLAIAADASAPIEQLDSGLLQAMKLGQSTPFRQRYDLLAPLVLRAVDLDLILQRGVGSGWRSVPAKQQADLIAAFQRYSISTYVANFDKYAGERFELSSAGTSAAGEPIIRVKIVPGKPGDDTHVLAYSMHQVGGAWKAFDVTADSSISAVVAQQDEIRAVFVRQGALSLLGRLQAKTLELSGGAVR